MILNINHLSFTVSNLNTSINFYQKLLGLKLIDISTRDPKFSERVTGIKGAHLKIAYLSAVNCSIELIEYLAPKGEKLDTSPCNIGSAHICFIVDNFEEMLKKLKANNVTFRGRLAVIPEGPNKGKRVLYFEDPDSNTIEFISSSK